MGPGQEGLRGPEGVCGELGNFVGGGGESFISGPKCPPRTDWGLQFVRSTQEGCGGLRGGNPAAFPKSRPIFQQPFSLPEKMPKPWQG